MSEPARDLGALLRHPRIWRGAAAEAPEGAATGWAELDAALPGRGWPVGALSELLVQRSGIGELSLLMPACRRLCESGRHIAMVAPPYLPYAPALQAHGVHLERLLVVRPRSEDAGWAAEQCLRSGAVAATVLWLEFADANVLRRLQLAAEQGRSVGWLFRPQAALRQSSLAALRAGLSEHDDHLVVEILKCRGRAGARIRLPRRETLMGVCDAG